MSSQSHSSDPHYPLVELHPGGYIEGFWSTEKKSFSNPFPTPLATNVPVDKVFLDKLKQAIPFASVHQSNQMPFPDKCQLCGCEVEKELRVFTLSGHGNSGNLTFMFLFPKGVIHYYTEHHVHPSKEFQQCILKLQIPVK